MSSPGAPDTKAIAKLTENVNSLMAKALPLLNNMNNISAGQKGGLRKRKKVSKKCKCKSKKNRKSKRSRKGGRKTRIFL